MSLMESVHCAEEELGHSAVKSFALGHTARKSGVGVDPARPTQGQSAQLWSVCDRGYGVLPGERPVWPVGGGCGAQAFFL